MFAMLAFSIGLFYHYQPDQIIYEQRNGNNGSEKADIYTNYSGRAPIVFNKYFFYE
jgi:hypothetical protein